MINGLPENHLFNLICRDFLSFSNGNGGWLREKNCGGSLLKHWFNMDIILKPDTTGNRY